jgi:hypothetical protein
VDENALSCNCAAPPHSRVTKRRYAENWVAESERGQREQDSNAGKVNHEGSIQRMQIVSEPRLQKNKKIKKSSSQR